MGALEPPHLIVILVIVLIIFGPGKLPQLGKALGDGIRELKHATSEDHAAQPAAVERPTGGAASAETRTCAQCQSPVPVAARFCGTCGAAQASAVSDSATTTTGAHSA